MLIGPQALKSLNSIEKIQPRMMVATFNGNPRAIIISCYSLTNVSAETELIAFHYELSSLVRSFPKHNVLVIGGDKNAQIGKNGNHKYSLHNSSNRNGQHLTDFTIENRLTCLNTNFQDKNAQIGKNGNHKYSQHNSSNRNGQHLTDFTIENRLTCLNTNFQKREGKIWTYTDANNTKAQIDYVFINKK